ncbi:MAG TPA: energy transducer TonB [Stellaceae bacterium]|nr:energy transducer TonB [Stellaceae bacterium]
MTATYLDQLRSTRSATAQRKVSPGRLTGIVVAVLLHVALVYALVTGLGRQAVEILQAPLQTKIIEEAKPPPPDVLPPPPKLADLPPPYIPPPEVRIQPSTTATNAITAIAHTPPPAPLPAAVVAPRPQPVHVPAVLGAASHCQKPEYPPMAQRLGEEGTVVLRFLVSAGGSVLQSQVASSSGHPRLDDAARDALSQCQFRPGTVDGKPEQSWAVIRYNWRIQ